MPTDLDTLTKSVMASLHQPAEKATAWASALNQSLITEKVQLVGLLQFDRTEKEAGRGGCFTVTPQYSCGKQAYIVHEIIR